MNTAGDFDRGLKAANRAQALADVTEMVFDLRVKVAQLEDVAAQLQTSLRGTEYSVEVLDETHHFFEPICWEDGPLWPFVVVFLAILLSIVGLHVWGLL
jgi:hypothetical protein